MTPTDTAPATRFRYVVLFLLCLLAMITYMDRAANGSAKDAIMTELNTSRSEGNKLNKEDFFIVLMAFQLAYAIFEVPSGWLGDTRGPRATLFRVVVWWSIFVALTGFVGFSINGMIIGFTALIIIQFLFGVGEAGAFPNIAKSLYNWFPANSRGFAKSGIWMSARLMGGLTPLLWVLIVEIGGLTWREAMWLFASAAAVWAIIFYFVFTNKPSEHSKVNPAELAVIHGNSPPPTHATVVPWGKLLQSRNLWCVCAMYVVTNFCWYFLMYNLPGALKNQFPEWKATDSGKCLLAILAGSPLLVGILGCYLGGVLSDRYIRRTGDRKWGRRIFGMLGYGGAGVCYLLAIGGKMSFPDNVWAYAIPLMMMGFFNDLIMAPAWAVCQDIGRQYAATVSGAMNMMGNLVGAVTGIFVTGMIMKEHTIDLGLPTEKVADKGFIIAFAIYAVVYFLGVGLWLLIDATKPVVPDETETAHA